MEYYLDHELNHYFDKFSKVELTDFNPSPSVYDKIREIALKAGFNLKTKSEIKDFTEHIFANEEFLEMCADIVNALKLYLNVEDKLTWFLEHATSKFLASQEYLNLPVIFRNALFFATITRLFNKSRWNYLIEHIQNELDTKLTLGKKVKFKVLTLLDRLKQ